MVSSKNAHYISFIIGSLFLLLSFYLAFFVKGSQFYTSFALGSWLVFDFIDYKLNNTSILAFFYNHKHRHTFYFFFFISFIFCFIVDYIWGVRVLKMWEWTNYGVIEFGRMYLITNASFVLGMYEIYRVIKTVLKKHITDEHVFELGISFSTRQIVYISSLFLGIIFLVSPLIFTVLSISFLDDYIMILPFASMILISDSVTFLTGGKPIVEEFIRFNKLKVAALLLTVLSAFIATEGLNLFGREWKYIRMPFYHIQIFTVPLSVLIGWIPLVIGTICIVNLSKHMSTLRRAKH